MNKPLDGKVAIITGSGAGIGREFALAFARHGARVIVNDLGRDESGQLLAQKVADEIADEGNTAIASTDSVADWDSANRIVECAVDNFGQLDAVVNNAGVVRDRMFHKMSPDEWKTVVDVHLNGSFFMARAAAPHFREQQSGAYVHMTSTSGLIGNVGQANYSAAKLGIVGLSKSIAMDMGRFKVRSNCIAPWAWTAMTATIPADSPENIARIEKMKKMEASKVAPLAVVLASDAARHISGQIFGARANELYLFNQIRMIRSIHRGEGWTPETIIEHALPAFEPSLFENVPSMAVTPWDPI